MPKLWKMAKDLGISHKGKKPELIARIVKAKKERPQPVEEKTDKKPEDTKAEKPKKDMVQATLGDGSKVMVPSSSVEAASKAKGGMVTMKSMDGRVLEAAVGSEVFIGKTIKVPVEMADEIRRLLKEGGFYVI